MAQFDMEDDDGIFFACDSCGGAIDEDDDDQYHEPTGWYFCPHCGHSNDGD